MFYSARVHGAPVIVTPVPFEDRYTSREDEKALCRDNPCGQKVAGLYCKVDHGSRGKQVIFPLIDKIFHMEAGTFLTLHLEEALNNIPPSQDQLSHILAHGVFIILYKQSHYRFTVLKLVFQCEPVLEVHPIILGIRALRFLKLLFRGRFKLFTELRLSRKGD